MSKTVLLVEDEPNIVEAISFLLERDGWTVRIHNEGHDAVAAVARVRPDVLVLDVMLPGRSGFEILRELRSNTGHGNMPILMLTARGQTKDRELAEGYGVNHYMTKPFSNEEMLATMRGLYEQSQSAAETEG